MNGEELAQFLADEGPAIEQLRRLIGGDAAKRLDGSSNSLGVVDTFVANLTSSSGWENSALFDGLGEVRKWLAIRVAYFIGLYARHDMGCEWYLSADAESPLFATPVLAIDGIEFSPLEVSWALLDGGVQDGLVGFFADLEVRRREESLANERRRRTSGCN